MKRKIWLFWWVFLSGCALSGQSDSLLLTKNFKFKDGVYLSFHDFQRNKPNYTWEEVNARLATGDEGFLAQVEYIRRGQQLLDLQQIWGICLGGIPYVRLPQGVVTSSATAFAGLRVRGKICYFKYKTEVVDSVEVKAYNPLNGLPYRQAKVPVERTVQKEKMLHFQTGAVADFTLPNLLSWIEDDRQLWSTMQELSVAEASEKLFRCLLIYIDRNAIYLPVNN